MAESESRSAKYNRIFELLVDNKKDKITGYVAYAIYKQKKRDWIRAFIEEHGCPPSDMDLDRHTNAEALPINIEILEKRAQTILAEYATEITQALDAELRERALASAVMASVNSTLSQVERNSSLSSQIKVAGVSTIISIIILIVLAIAIALFGIDPVDGATRIREMWSGGASRTMTKPGGRERASSRATSRHKRKFSAWSSSARVTPRRRMSAIFSVARLPESSERWIKVLAPRSSNRAWRSA